MGIEGQRTIAWIDFDRMPESHYCTDGAKDR